jgi:hypothetical protein
MKITQPGIYRGISSEDYFADPCPIPSLTQSQCKTMLERSAKHVWTHNPRLNPNYEPDDDTKFDVGNVAHRLVLGRGKDFEVIDFEDWRTKAAKEAREEAAKAGKIAVLKHQFQKAFDMAGVAQVKLSRHQERGAFTNGDAEVMIAWEEDGVWFRSLIDWLHADLRTVDDYKSTAKSVADHVLGYVAFSGMWHVQAAFIERGLDVLDPANAGRRRFRFIAQETDKPHELNVMPMNKHWMTMGHKQVSAAIAKWTPAVKANRWGGYSPRPVEPEFPAYQEKAWLERELSGEFENNNPDLVFAG